MSTDVDMSAAARRAPEPVLRPFHPGHLSRGQFRVRLDTGLQLVAAWHVVGIAAAFIGSWIARLLGVQDTPGIDWIEVIVQIIVAAVGVSVVAGMYGRKAVR